MKFSSQVAYSVLENNLHDDGDVADVVRDCFTGSGLPSTEEGRAFSPHLTVMKLSRAIHGNWRNKGTVTFACR